MPRRVLIVKSDEPIETMVSKIEEMIEGLELSIVRGATKWYKPQEHYHIWAPGVVNFNVDIKYQPISKRNITRIEVESTEIKILDKFIARLEKELQIYFGSNYTEQQQPAISIFGISQSAPNTLQAFEILAKIELGLRRYIQTVLTRESGDDWWEKCVGKEIRDRAKKRRETEQEIGWLVGTTLDLISYTNFGDLAKILRRPNNRSHFKDAIASIDGIDVWQAKLKMLEKIRNRIAHNRSISHEDLQRLIVHAKDIQKALSKEAI